MLKNRKKILSFLITLFFAAIFVWYVSSNWETFKEIDLVRPLLLIPGAFLIMANIYCLGMLLDLAIEPHGIKLKKLEVFGLSSITRFGNFVSSGYLGTAARAIYLKKTYKISYTKFSSSFILSNLLQLVYSGLIALLIYVYTKGFLFDSRPILIILISVLVIFFLINLPAKRLANYFSKYKGKKLRHLSVALAEYDKVRSHPKLLSYMFLWMLLALGSSSLLLFLLYQALGFSVPLLSVIFIAIVGGWAIIFSITPANIGVSEGLLVIGAQIMGVSIPATLAVAILKRIFTFAVSFALASYFSPKLLNMSLMKIQKIKPAE